MFKFDSYEPTICKYEMDGKKMKTIDCDHSVDNWKIDSTEQSFSVYLESGNYVVIGSKKQPYDKGPTSPYFQKFNTEKLKLAYNDSSFLVVEHEFVEKLFNKIGKNDFGVVVK